MDINVKTKIILALLIISFRAFSDGKNIETSSSPKNSCATAIFLAQSINAPAHLDINKQPGKVFPLLCKITKKKLNASVAVSNEDGH